MKNKIYIFFNRIAFNLQYPLYIHIVKKSNSLLAYPLLIDMTFNREYYWRKYLKGYPINKVLIRRVEKMVKRMKFVVEGENITLQKRYKQFCEHYQKKEEVRQELREYFPDHFPKAGGEV